MNASDRHPRPRTVWRLLGSTHAVPHVSRPSSNSPANDISHWLNGALLGSLRLPETAAPDEGGAPWQRHGSGEDQQLGNVESSGSSSHMRAAGVRIELDKSGPEEEPVEVLTVADYEKKELDSG